MTDLEIARSVSHKTYFEVAQTLGIPSKTLIPYGRYKAKIAANTFGAGEEPAARAVYPRDSH